MRNYTVEEIKQALNNQCYVCKGWSPASDGHDTNPPCRGTMMDILIESHQKLMKKQAKKEKKLADLLKEGEIVVGDEVYVPHSNVRRGEIVHIDDYDIARIKDSEDFYYYIATSKLQKVPVNLRSNKK